MTLNPPRDEDGKYVKYVNSDAPDFDLTDAVVAAANVLSSAALVDAAHEAQALNNGGPRVYATFQPQYWRNDYAIDAGPAVRIDVTDIIAEMTQEERDCLEDNRDSTDNLYFEAVRRGLAPSHDGPSYTQVRDSLDEYEEAQHGGVFVEDGILICDRLDALNIETVGTGAIVNFGTDIDDATIVLGGVDLANLTARIEREIARATRAPEAVASTPVPNHSGAKATYVNGVLTATGARPLSVAWNADYSDPYIDIDIHDDARHGATVIGRLTFTPEAAATFIDRLNKGRLA